MLHFVEVRKAMKEAPFGCLFLVFVFFPSFSNGQSLEELDRFQFGAIAVTSNSGVSELDFPRSGRNIVITGSIIIVASGLPGRYRITGLPPNTSVDVEVNDAELIYQGGGFSERLLVTDYDTPEVVAGNDGELEIQIGGVLRTTGTGGVYEDGLYSRATQLLLTYWNNEVGEYVTRGFDINIEAELRTSFSLEEESSMSFGTIFARSSADEQAQFILAPDGKFSILNDGNARMVSLSEPMPAVLVVSGAAPSRDLSISLPVDDILLQNSEEPSAPHFILSDFVSSPSDIGRTDSDGMLDIFLGGTLSTQLTTEEIVYPAGTYEATYDITVSY